MRIQTKRLRYSDTELVAFKRLIEKRIHTTQFVLAYLESLPSTNENDLQILKQTSNLEALMQALKRIDTRRYGICTQTGQLIDKRYLKIVPFITTVSETTSLKNLINS